MKNVILGTMLMMHNIFDPGHKLFTGKAKRKRRGMALVKLGGGVADIRGSVGGTVFSRNRYGAYARNRTIPVDPGSTAQTKIRATLGNVRDAWFSTLTQAQRDAWAVYAANVQVVNRIGESINLTGWNMFARTNTALLYNDESIIAAAPTDFSLAEQDATLSITVSEATQMISVAFDDTMDWVGEDGAFLFIYASRPQNPTVNFFKGPYLLAGQVSGNGTTAPTSPTTMSLPFAAVAGQKIYVQARIVRADGRMSEPFRVTSTDGSIVRTGERGLAGLFTASPRTVGYTSPLD
jgi:hypothetical protein